MSKKLKVGVMMGGPGSEREISLVTGQAVCDNLDKKKYLIYSIEMDKQGILWLKTGKKKTKLDLINKDRKKFDIIFLAMHGAPGESGGIQGMLDTLNIKYTGSEALSSALAMNKVYAGQIYLINGLPHPLFVHFKLDGWKENKITVLTDISKKIGYPAVVKPVDQGSAVGVGIIKNEDELVKFIDKTIKKFPWLMVQKFIDGQEGTCGILEKDGQILPLPPTHILPKMGKFYDYKSKYKSGGSQHICPADFSHGVNEQVEALAVQAHRALGCRGMSRTDIFVDKANKLWVIETNTIPGMTPTSLFPEAAEKTGISFTEMLDLIIKASL